MTALRRALLLGAALWLLSGACLPAHARGRTVRMVFSRVSCYAEGGTAYDGTPTVWGVTAGASWDIPLEATVVFPGGETRVITDRGLTPWGNGTLEAPSWIDVYDPTCQYGSWPVSEYGDYAWLQVWE